MSLIRAPSSEIAKQLCNCELMASEYGVVLVQMAMRLTVTHTCAWLSTFSTKMAFLPGRLDAVPVRSPFTCMALVICCDDHSGDNQGQPDTTYLLLVRVEKGPTDNASQRIGGGRTIDDTHGFPGKTLKTHEKELFLLV